MRWDNLKVLATDWPKLIETRETSRYFAARETDAASLQTTDQEKRENEKFLFYRGVGDVEMSFAHRAIANSP